MRHTRRDFLKHAATVATVIAVPAMTGCTEEEEQGPDLNETWEARADELEKVTWTASDPGTKPDVHIPVVTYNASGRTVTVSVPHVMTPEHYITTIYIRDQDGIVLGLQEYAQPSAEGDSPSVDLTLHESTTSVVAYAYCNLHDNWAGGSIST